MYVLVVRDPQGNETEFDLVGDAILGRDASAGVQLPDPGVSRQHARLFLEDGFCYLEDLGSANGTLIEGVTVTGAVVLEANVEVAIGPFVVWIEEPEGAAAPAGIAEETLLAPGLTPDTYAGPAPIADDGATFGDAPVDPASMTRLEGMGGVAFGRTFELVPRTGVGRVAGNLVVLDDVSVSRQHAELVQQPMGWVVRDLGSSNGTFVNEQPVTEQVLADGDVVRFGEVELRFVDPMASVAAVAPPLGAPAGGPMPPVAALRRGRRGGGGLDKRKKILLGAGVGMIVLIAMGMALKSKKPPAPTGGGGPAAATPQNTDLKEQVFSLSRRGKALMEAEKWTEAGDLFQQVLELDPINRDAREALDQTKLEKKMQLLYSDAERKSELGEEEAALSLYTQIEKRSAYNRRARYKVRGLVELLMKRYEAECKGNYRANRYKDAHKTCGRYMDFACQCPGTGSKEVESLLRKTDKRHHPREAWRCPTDLAAWVPCEHRGPSVDVEDELKRAYPAKSISSAVLAYYKGEIDDAMKSLDKVRHDYGKGQTREIAQELFSQMKIVQGKYSEGLALILKGDPVNAHEGWKVALAADEKIIPSDGLRSFYRTEMLRRIIGAYAEKGNEDYNRERYIDAYHWFEQAATVDASDRRVKEGLQNLDRAAAYLLQRAVSCPDFKAILDMTQDVSPTHKQAATAAERHGCQY